MRIDGEDPNDDEVIEVEGEEQEAPAAEAEPEDEALELEIEGEDEPQQEPPLIKQMRDQLRRAQLENAELKRGNAPKASSEVGPRPTLESCDYDEEKYTETLLAWQDNKSRNERQQREQTEASERKNREFENLKAKHRARAAALKISDFEQAEEALVDAIGPELAGAALVTATDSARLVAAVGKSPSALAKLSAEPDPLKRLAMLIRMEGNIQVKKKPVADAETIQRSTTSIARTGNEKKLKELEAEADRTGNRTKLIDFKRQLKMKENTR